MPKAINNLFSSNACDIFADDKFQQMEISNPSNFIDLNDTLIEFSERPEDAWMLQDALRGTQIFGGIGSGKTSGSGRVIAGRFLEEGFGGIVLCAKPDEKDNWLKLAEENNRAADVVIFEEGSDYFFNPLNYESTRFGRGAGESYNLVNLFMNIYQMGRAFSGEGMSKEGDRFWDNALKRCMRRMIDFLKLAGEDVSVLNMQSLITSALSKEEIEQLNEIRNQADNNKAYDELTEWSERSYYIKCYIKAFTKYAKLLKEGAPTLEETKFTLQMLQNYFEREFGNLAERTRTIIIESFLGIAEPFLGGILKKHFAGKTNIQPEWTYQKGSIIILDFPIKNYLDAGVYAQGIFKLLFQQAMERRDFKPGKDRPVFLWVDESQFFLSDYDQTFQTTARSSGTCTVFLSQNISNYYAALGGKDPKPKVDSLLANLSTKIFHGNNDAVTNEWASRTIGKEFRLVRGFSSGDKSESINSSQQLHDMVGSAEFTMLKGGGKTNDFIVEAILTVAGKKWSNGQNHLRVEFEQT